MESESKIEGILNQHLGWELNKKRISLIVPELTKVIEDEVTRRVNEFKLKKTKN